MGDDQLTALDKSNLRIAPRQQRAQNRIRLILQATEELLEKGQEVTTSAIAAQAEIPVGSIYRYFPNLLGIYRALFETLNGDLVAQAGAIISHMDASKKWQDQFSDVLDVSVAFFQKHPAYGNLLAMMTDPALNDAKDTSLKTVSDLLASRWRAGHDGFSGGNIDAVAQTAAKLFLFVEANYFEHARHGLSDAALGESIKALKAYLSLYLKS